MIQPAAPSVLAPPPARSSSRQPGAAAFALPGIGGGNGDGDADAIALVVVPAGDDRHDDAAPGNLLPIAVAATPVPTIDVPAIALPPAPDGVATPPALSEPRAPKFALPVPMALPVPRDPASLPVEGTDANTAADRDDRTPSDDPPPVVDALPVAMPLPAVVPAPLPAPMIAATPAADRPIAPAVGEPTVDPRIAAVTPDEPTVDPRIAASTPDEPTVGPRVAAASPDGPTVDPRIAAATPSAETDPAIAPTVPPPTVVTASALATSSLTPLRRPLIDAEAPLDRVEAAPPRTAAQTMVRTMSTSTTLRPTTTIPGGTPVPAAAVILASTTAARAGGAIGVDPTVRATGRSSPVAARPASANLDPTVAPSANVATPAPLPLPAGWQMPSRVDAVPAVSSNAGPLSPSLPVSSASSVAIPTNGALAAAQPAAPEKRLDAPAAMPLPLPPVAPAAPAPAGIVFGAARFAAQVADDRDEPTAPIGLAPLAAAQAVERAVATVPASAQGPLDLRQEHWPHAMIERIEMIRNAADAADTRIRLVPDALGAIDVEVKRDGDTLNVRFHAEQAQTRTLLADAAPRLAEAAEARGLRLGQTSIGGGAGADAGTASQGQQRQPQPDTAPRAPVSTVADAGSADDVDTRLA